MTKAQILAERFSHMGVTVASQMVPTPKPERHCKLLWCDSRKSFWVTNSYPIKNELKRAGFEWNTLDRRWETKNRHVAMTFIHLAGNDLTRKMVKPSN